MDDRLRPWLVSMMMWLRFMRHVPEQRVAGRDLARLTGLDRKGAHRDGWRADILRAKPLRHFPMALYREWIPRWKLTLALEDQAERNYC